MTRILKTLEGRGLVKNVKSVQHANRKVYMLAELEPASEITGGAWCVTSRCLHHVIDWESHALCTSSCTHLSILHPLEHASGDHARFPYTQEDAAEVEQHEMVMPRCTWQVHKPGV